MLDHSNAIVFVLKIGFKNWLLQNWPSFTSANAAHPQPRRPVRHWAYTCQPRVERDERAGITNCVGGVRAQGPAFWVPSAAIGARFLPDYC